LECIYIIPFCCCLFFLEIDHAKMMTVVVVVHATGRQIYKQARVVGITCATAKMILGKGPEVVSNFGTFPIVLFEDSPRFIASVGLDCCRLAKCSAVVSVGDPKQQVGTLFVNDEPATRGGNDHTSGKGVMPRQLLYKLNNVVSVTWGT
jgi:hypothetical protein